MVACSAYAEVHVPALSLVVNCSPSDPQGVSTTLYRHTLTAKAWVAGLARTEYQNLQLTYVVCLKCPGLERDIQTDSVPHDR